LTAAHIFLSFFSVFIINASSLVLFLSQENVCKYYTFHYYTHIRYFCVSSLHGFSFVSRNVFVFVVWFFFSSNFNLFNLFWFFIHVVNDLIFSFVLLFSFIKSQFFLSFFLLLFALFLYSSVRITQLHVLLTKNK
jgi:hypothetical protein